MNWALALWVETERRGDARIYESLRLLAVAAVLFRFDLGALIAPLALCELYRRRIKFWKGVRIGVAALTFAACNF